MDDIANEMSISKKTIYQHFSNKTELVKNVTTYVFSSIACGIDEIIEQSTNPIEELYDIKQFVLLQLKMKSKFLKQRFLLNEKTVNTLITLGVSMELGATQLKNASITFLVIAQAYFK